MVAVAALDVVLNHLRRDYDVDVAFYDDDGYAIWHDDYNFASLTSCYCVPMGADINVSVLAFHSLYWQHFHSQSNDYQHSQNVIFGFCYVNRIFGGDY